MQSHFHIPKDRSNFRQEASNMVGDAIAVPTHLPPRSKNVYRRERWGSRAAFYFAAIGAAVGFG